MKKGILIVIGLTPVPMGYWINHLACVAYPDRALPYLGISIGFLFM